MRLAKRIQHVVCLGDLSRQSRYFLKPSRGTITLTNSLDPVRGVVLEMAVFWSLIPERKSKAKVVCRRRKLQSSTMMWSFMRQVDVLGGT